MNMSVPVPILPPLPRLPDTEHLTSLAATAQSPNSTATSLDNVAPIPSSASAASSPPSASTPSTASASSVQDSSTASSTASPASSSTSTSDSIADSTSSATAGSAAVEREYYDAPGSTVRGSSVWQSIRLIRGDDDHVHCMRCNKDLKHNRTQARLTGTSNLSRHLRKCKGPPLPGTDTADERKDGRGSDKKRKREAVEEGKDDKKDDKKEGAAMNGPRAQRGAAAAAQLENGERAGHHASLLQLQTLHDAALSRLEQTKQQLKVEHAEQLSGSELKKMMQWHSTAIQRLQRVAVRQLSEEWKERAGKNVCKCCVDVEIEVQLEPCKHVIWCRGCSNDRCAVCGIAVLGKATVSPESRGDG